MQAVQVIMRTISTLKNFIPAGKEYADHQKGIYCPKIAALKENVIQRHYHSGKR